MTPDLQRRSLGGLTRARDADRETALVALREALVDGQLAQEEFDARMAAVLAAKRVGELTKLTADLQQPSPQALRSAALSTRPRWQRVFGPAIIVLVVALGLAGIEGLTRLGGDNQGIESDEGGSIGFPGLNFPGNPDLHTADGMRQFVADVEERFGTTETLRAVIYPEYVVMWMPQSADPTRVDTHYYDGNFDEPSPAGTRDPEAEPLFDLADVDVDALALLILQAPDAVGIDEPESTYAVIDRRFEAVSPLMSVYVSDPYVSGRLEANLDGSVTEVYEAS